MRISSKLIVAVLLLGAMFQSQITWAQQNGSLERALFDAANHERQSQGLPTLKWDNALAGAAERHAAVMAQQGTLSHQFPGEASLASRATQAGVHFVWLSENVAQGPNAEFIHSQWVKSPNHRANLLDRDMDSIGIAVAQRDGQWFAVEDFSKAKR